MKNNIITTIKKELRATVRDKKSLLMMILTPLLIPFFIFIFSFIYDSMINDDTKEIYNIGINYALSEEETKIIEELDLKTEYYKSNDELQSAYENKLIDAYITKEDNNYVIYANTMSERSSYASNYASMYLTSYNDLLAQSYLTSINADINQVYSNVNYTTKELTGSNDFINEIITMGFIFAIMAITLTAIYSATDSTAGEKERGTLETFLTFPIKSEELITGKYLAIVICCFITSIISTLLAVISFRLSTNMFDIYNDAILNFNFQTISLSLLIMFGFSIFISGLCIAIASHSKTYKEAQSALTPISLLTMIPMFLDILKIDLTPALALMPIVNHTMLLKTVFCSTIGESDIINISIMFISTIIYSIIIIKLITKQYKSEKILFSI